MAKELSKQSILMIQILLTDEKISEKILENSDDKEKYKICTIKENGSVVFGKTNVQWWNRLLNCQDVIPFESLALKIWDALVDMSTGPNQEAILRGLSQDIIITCIREREYNDVVDRIYEVWRHAAQKSKGYRGIPAFEEAKGNRVLVTKSNPQQIVINVDGVSRTIPIIDSVGDTFSVGLDFGLKGLRRVY